MLFMQFVKGIGTEGERGAGSGERWTAISVSSPLPAPRSPSLYFASFFSRLASSSSTPFFPSSGLAGSLGPLRKMP